jgi:L-ascorbate metabolism protein UlaG (beta-lactamase superfamily)
MQIEWQGHACFRIRGNGVCIVTDPYTPEVAGLSPLSEPADVVIMSSDDDPFHSDAADVPGNPLILNALEIARRGGTRQACGVQFDAIETQESLVHKKDPGENAMYAFTVDGVRVGHMGDVGNPLTPAQIEFLRGADVLLALTGGPVTIELDDLDTALKAIGPKVVIPMHYQIPNLKLNILGLEAFTSRYPAERVEVAASTAIEVTQSSLPAHMRIVALQPAANRARSQPG